MKDRPKCFTRLLSLLLSLLFSSPLILSAEDGEPASRKVKYNSETSFSLVLVKGNTDSLSYSLDTRQNIEILKNRILLSGRFILSRSDGTKTAEVYSAHLKYDRKLGNRAYLLGYTSYDQNRLAGFNYRLALSLGGGMTWMSGERTKTGSSINCSPTHSNTNIRGG